MGRAGLPGQGSIFDVGGAFPVACPGAGQQRVGRTTSVPVGGLGGVVEWEERCESERGKDNDECGDSVWDGWIGFGAVRVRPSPSGCPLYIIIS